jgi:hypothetical protein
MMAESVVELLSVLAPLLVVLAVAALVASALAGGGAHEVEPSRLSPRAGDGVGTVRFQFLRGAGPARGPADPRRRVERLS